LNGLQTPTSSGAPQSIYSANGIYGYDGSSYGSGYWYGSHMYSSGLYGGWSAPWDGKYNPRGRSNGYYAHTGNLDGFNEMKRGPRSALFKNNQGLGATETPAKNQEVSATDDSNTVMKDQYNLSDFMETYSDAKFFIIKSYSEDDVHKSIKYNVWASTPNGNKKLDAAYQEAKENSNESSVFLLFSVSFMFLLCGTLESLLILLDFLPIGLVEVVHHIYTDDAFHFPGECKWSVCWSC
jgi:YTH domain-containing family protein